MTEELLLQEIEEKKRRYRQVKEQLQTVSRNVKDFQSSMIDLKNSLTVGLLVDKKIISEDSYNEIISGSNKVSSNIGQAISVINSKL